MKPFKPDQEWIDRCNRIRKDKSITLPDIADAINVSTSKVGRSLQGLYEISERKKKEISDFLENAKPQKIYADPKMMQDLLYECKEIGYSKKYFHQKLDMTATHFNNIINARVQVSPHTLNRMITMMTKIIEE